VAALFIKHFFKRDAQDKRKYNDRRLGTCREFRSFFRSWWAKRNKVSSAVELRFEALRSPNLPTQVKVRLKKLVGRRWTNEGAIVIQVEETRYQARNREIARKRLKELILKATIVQKKRIATKPTASSQRRRIKSKKQRGEIKVGRKTIRKESDLDF